MTRVLRPMAKLDSPPRPKRSDAAEINGTGERPPGKAPRLAPGTMLVVTHTSSDIPIGGAPMPVPGGPVDATVAPQPVLEVARPAWFMLMAPGWMPPAGQVTQALGICVTADGRVVMVTWDDEHWTFPGGSVEPGETVEQALVREVAEEACVRVVACEYLACQHVADPLNPGEVASYYQTRWWTRVSVQPWRPRHEMTGRRLVAPDLVLATLFWQEKAIAGRLLDLALAADRRYRAAS